MNTFAQKYCRACNCEPKDFARRLFWRCLHRHALPVAPLLLLFKPRYFDADRELIAEVGRAERMTQVWEEIRDYFLNPRHTGWLRRRAHIRLSARRLIQVARAHLPASSRPPPAYAASSEEGL